jgi:type IV pilus assembly protein PilE
MELVIAVAVVAILTAIALPAYQNQIRKSQRTAARTALLDLASRQEKFYALNNSYTSDATALGYANAAPIAVPGGGSTYYNLTIVADNTVNPATYTGTATPTGGQASDSCGTYTFNSKGQQTPTTAGCW